MAAMMDAYVEDYQRDPDLQYFDDICKTYCEAFKNTAGEGGLPVNQLKEAISSICSLNSLIANKIEQAKEAGEKECLKLVELYFSCTSEMLHFCCELNRFIDCAKESHSYITHVIQHLETHHGIETIDDDANGVKGNGHYMVILWKWIISWFDNYFNDNMISRNHFRKIVEVLENLRKSVMVSSDYPAKSLLQSYERLQKKLKEMDEALKSHNDKLQKKLKHTLTWKRITNMIFIGTTVCVGICGLVTLAVVIAQPVLAGTVTVITIGMVLKSLVPPLSVAHHWANSWFKQTEENILKQKVAVELMQGGTTIAIKEFEDIKSLIEELLIHIDSFVKTGKFGLNQTEDYNVGFAMKRIKDRLKSYLEKIMELEKEANKCTSQIRTARDDVLRVTNKAKVVKKGKQA